MSDKCNFNAFVDRKISNKNRSIDTIIDIQHDANINLDTNIASKYNPKTVSILNKNPRLALQLRILNNSSSDQIFKLPFPFWWYVFFKNMFVMKFSNQGT